MSISTSKSPIVSGLSIAYFGGGCFWCTEGMFKRLKGVKSVTSGYAGGFVSNPTYEAVCAGHTGHAEVIQIEYDPDIISYNTLLEVFFLSHDPTTLNQQGNDYGSQYRSIILTNSKDEVEAATKAKTTIPHAVTEIVPFTDFYPAETYHQNYFDNNQSAPYCRMVISPKINKLQQHFSDLVK